MLNFNVSCPAYPVTGPKSQYPALPGVYAIWCNYGNGNPVNWNSPAYIGQTANFQNRAIQHRYSPRRLFTDAAMMTFLHVPDAKARLATERWLIERHKPSYNLTHRRGA